MTKASSIPFSFSRIKNNSHLLQAIEWFRYGRKLCIVMELARAA